MAPTGRKKALNRTKKLKVTDESHKPKRYEYGELSPVREFNELFNEGDEEETGDQVFMEDIQMQKTVESPIANSEQSAAEDEEETTYHLDGQSGEHSSNDTVTDEIYADRNVPNQNTSVHQTNLKNLNEEGA